MSMPRGVDPPEGFADFVAARSTALLRSAWLLTGDLGRAEDLLQTALAKAWRRWRVVAAADSPEAYVRRVIFTTYVSWWRLRWRAERPITGSAEQAGTVDATGARDIADQFADRDALRRALARLSRQQRAVVVLRYAEDLSVQRTAQVLGCTQATVKTQASRALALLRTDPHLRTDQPRPGGRQLSAGTHPRSDQRAAPIEGGRIMTEPLMGAEAAADDLRRLLANGVPALPAPADRVREVAARVRRGRRRRGAFAVLAVAAIAVLAVSLPALVAERATAPTPASSLGPDGCPLPGTTPERYHGGRPEPFDLPAGADQLTLCELVTDPVFAFRFDPQAGQPRVLTGNVTPVLDVLARLPDLDTMRGDTPEDQFGGCPAVGYPTELSFVLRYPDRAPVVLWLDRNCGAAIYAGRARFDLNAALTAFLAHYREQRAAAVPPGSLTAPPCPDRLDAVDPTTLEGQFIRDEIGRQRAVFDPFLPSPLAAASACRYDVGVGVGQLTGGEPLPSTVLERLRGEINDMIANAESTECNTGLTPQRATLLDVLQIVDDTGAVTHIRLARLPCVAATINHRPGLIVTPDLLTLVNAQLGGPR